jgi:hypothetical protein
MNAVAVEILTDARKRVEAGWVQRRAYNEAGDVCAGHAIDLAYQSLIHKMHASQDDRYEAVQWLSKAIDLATNRRWPGGIPDWNDHDGRTKAEVLAAFEHAIQMGQWRNQRTPLPKKVQAVWSPLITFPASTTYNLFPATVESIPIETYEKVMETVSV